MPQSTDRTDWSKMVSAAVKSFWRTRSNQVTKQQSEGRSDQGSRGAATGGAQMNGFIKILTDAVISSGIRRDCVFTKARVDVILPGFYRPTKEWDLLVVVRGQLVLAIEAKSHIGPSFSNNFNNRTEEAMGSAVDLWTAFREGGFNTTVRPWLGYVLLLEDGPKSRRPVVPKEPHFKVRPEFARASCVVRYEWFCRRLVRERQYDAACLIASPAQGGLRGEFNEPAKDLGFDSFARSLIAHASAHVS